MERIIVSNEGNDASLYDDDDSNKDDTDSEVDWGLKFCNTQVPIKTHKQKLSNKNDKMN